MSKASNLSFTSCNLTVFVSDLKRGPVLSDHPDQARLNSVKSICQIRQNLSANIVESTVPINLP